MEITRRLLLYKSLLLTFISISTPGITLTFLILTVQHPIPQDMATIIGQVLAIAGMILVMGNVIKPLPGKYTPYIAAVVFASMISIGLWLMIPNPQLSCLATNTCNTTSLCSTHLAFFK